MIQWARLWRQQRHSIVFVNGCFDVLHLGHFYLLDRAKRAGTRLIVAVNSDGYCRRHKGESRPIQPVELRALIAGQVVNAHAVTVFDDDTPEQLLCGIRPDIYMLGDDYAYGNHIPGASHCDRVVTIPRLPGISTTGILNSL